MYDCLQDILVFFVGIVSESTSKVADLFVNVVASMIWLLIGLTASYLYRRYRTRGNRRVWKDFLKRGQQIRVVLTDKEGTKARSPRKISITDVRAFSDLRTALHDIGLETDLQESSGVTLDELAGSPFITLGGPKANGVTEALMARCLPRLPVAVEIPTGGEASAYFKHGAETLTPELDDDGRIAVDYGVLVLMPRMDRALTDSPPALIAFGLHGHGTRQVVACLLKSSDLRKLIADAKDSNFYALMKFEFKNGRFFGQSILAAGSVGYP